MSSFVADKPRVLISGAGPTGLILALALVKNGIPVRIIEKDSAFHVGQRGSGIHPRTFELFNYLGALPDILKEARPNKLRCIYEMPGGVKPAKYHDMTPHVPPTPDVPYSNPLILGQSQLEAILRDHLLHYNTIVELNTELVDFEQSEQGVKASIVKRNGDDATSEELDVEYLVGAEGARSLVRKKLGLTFLGVSRPSDRMIVGDIVIKNLNEEYWHSWGDRETKAIFLRPTEHQNIFSFMAFGLEADLDTLMKGRDGVIDYIVDTTHRKELEFGDLVWLSDFKPNVRMVNKFGEGRVFVIGDSAHVHSPTGGQGMNSGAQDAVNLGWKLALVCKSSAPPSLLETYSVERLPVIKEMLERTTQILEKTHTYRADGKDNSGWDRPRILHQLGVNCRWSPIVVDEQPDHEAAAKAGAYLEPDPTVLYAGDRAPEAPGLQVISGSEGGVETISLFKIFGPNYHTALIFATDADSAHVEPVLAELNAAPAGTIKTVIVYGGALETAGKSSTADLIVQDAEGHAVHGYPPVSKGFNIILVRPDGTVGAIVAGAAGVRGYLSKVFAL